MRGEGFDRAVALAVLALVALAAGLEGGVVSAYGGAIFAAAAVVGAGWVYARGVDPLPRAAKVGFALLGVVVLYQLVPIPNGLRALVAPGQAAWMDRVAPEHVGDLGAWLAASTEFDVLAAIGAAGDWAYDPLAGAVATELRAGGIAPDEGAWVLGRVLGLIVAFVVGTGLGRSPVGTRTVLVGMLVLGLAEAVFGIANREGGTTGIGPRLHYLGSATGTFVNRSHFAGFLVLAVGCAWGLAAALFPLQSEEVRRHRARRTRSSHPPSIFEASGDKLPRLGFLAFLVSVLLVAVVASQGRAPILGFAASAVAVGVWMAVRRKEMFHLVIALGVPVAGGLLAAFAFGLRGAFGRFVGLVRGGDGSVTSRLDLWHDGLRAWLDAPLFGAGLGGWDTAHPLHETADHLWAFQYAHNEPLQILAEQGLVGLLGWALVAFAAGRGLLRALRAVPHDEGTAAGAGVLVGVLAVLLQSLGDFPLHVPGLALPWALLAGIAAGALTHREREGARWPAYALAAATFAVCAAIAAADADFAGTRAERLAERGQIWADPRRDSRRLADVAAWGEDARARAALRPLDPWAHAAVAEAEARLAAAAWVAKGPRPVGNAPEDHAFRAELAISRALALRPRDPRLAITLGQALALLGAHASAGDGFQLRAARLFADAVSRDGWRAEEAFKGAERLPTSLLDPIGASGKGSPRVVARVHTAWGKALERRGERTRAAEVYAAAIATDVAYGPALFAAGTLARQLGDAATAQALLRRYVYADERAPGVEGWAFLLLDELDQAEMRLRRVASQSPNNRWAWEGLAEIAKRRGKTADERVALERILAIDPGFAPAKGRLEVLESR